jgi:aminoglycoside phosphotransferase family enzyme/predicted kinase
MSNWCDHAETHVSGVAFFGDLALKVLKPLETAFLDHADLESRRVATQLELVLNSRLAPDVYLGVVPLTDADGTIHDYGILMRRLPEDRRLSSIIETDEFPDRLREVARQVAVFHAAQEPDPEAEEIAALPAEAARWKSNFDELEELAIPVGLDRDRIDRARRLSVGFLDHREALFLERATAGMCRDGHGDLLANDIFCLDDGPRILDCLAFSTKLRKGDVLADVAFLVMDLERQAGPRSAQQFLRWYQEFSNEHHPASLAHFYVAYRALVRAKVAALRHGQSHDALDALEASDLLGLCLDHLERARPRIVLIGGGPGTGKTTLAEAVGDMMRFSVLRSDELRKDLAEQNHHEHAFASPDDGLYQPEMTAETYATLCEQAARLVQRGESVVLDASWSQAEHREAARASAASCGAEVIELECVVDLATAKERIVRRLASPWTVSDATPAIADHMADRHDAWPEAVVIDTRHPLSQSRSAALTAVLRLAEENVGEDRIGWWPTPRT